MAAASASAMGASPIPQSKSAPPSASRNDIFNTSWLPTTPPPRPLRSLFTRSPEGKPDEGAWAPGTAGGTGTALPTAELTDTQRPTPVRYAAPLPPPFAVRSRQQQHPPPPPVSSSPYASQSDASPSPALFTPRLTAHAYSHPHPTAYRSSSPHTGPAPAPVDSPLVASAHLCASPPTSPSTPATFGSRSAASASLPTPTPPPFTTSGGFGYLDDNMTFTPDPVPAIPPPLVARETTAASDDTARSSTPASSKTSSFFAAAADTPTPAPAPRLPSTVAPSPLSLSRASSLRTRALPPRTTASSPPPVPVDTECDECEGVRLPSGPGEPSGTSPRARSQLSALHQSPSLPPAMHAAPSLPLPPAADHIQLRLYPDSSYLLGEGRHARVYLAAYRRLSGGLGTAAGDQGPVAAVNGAPADGHDDNEWTLCAAKRLASDRESQTLGLREAFFLNRLRAPRDGKAGRSAPGTSDRGRVYVVKLIAVKEDGDEAAATSGRPLSANLHSRSVSDTLSDAPPRASSPVSPSAARALKKPIHVSIDGGSPTRARPRSSTIFAGGRGEHPAAEGAGAGLSRLVLVLEHAPLGTLDRLLRTSPQLVGQQLWGRWALEAAEALEWVHSRGVVHADIKPSNLLLTADLHIRLSDFGSSLLVHPLHPPTDGVGLGTLPFSPPELVDPAAPFSFPVDIFALGATLYQCITGREPYRGRRPIEMMHHVRNGNLWEWEEHARLARMGIDGEGTGTGTGTGVATPATATGSPYPSSARYDPVPPASAEIRRASSLRVPLAAAVAAAASPTGLGTGTGASVLERSLSRKRSARLPRVGSAESLQAADDVVSTPAGESPTGVRAWHQWVKGAHPRAVARLLRSGDADEPEPASPGLAGSGIGGAVSRSSSLRRQAGYASISRSSSVCSARASVATSPTSPTASSLSPTSPSRYDQSASWGAAEADADAEAEAVDARPYLDGAPAMYFLGEPRARVPDDVRDVLAVMLSAAPDVRPTASELISAWQTLGVGAEGEDEESGVEPKL